MRLLSLLSIFLCSLLISCGNDELTGPNKESAAQLSPPPSLKKRIVLIVDISSSLTVASKNLAAKYAAQVAQNLSDKSHLLIYTTEKNIAAQAIIDEKKFIPLKPMDKANYQAKIWPAIENKIHKTVLQKCNTGEPTSCILDGLKSARTGISGGVQAKETFLLILSDMLEDCHFGRPVKGADFAKMKEKLEKSDLDSFQLVNVIPEGNITICYINQDARAGNAAMINSVEFREFWKQAFKMLGYSDWPQPVTSIDAFLEKID
ncbi:MAG: hypothetical protein KDD14_14080 [Saprospiraceae bacterium]|nr:hypothetical protein [Saprospiraceae bacterium]